MNSTSRNLFSIILFISLLFTNQIIFSQIPGPGEPTNGTSAPLDGGFLIISLIVGSFITALVKNKSKNKSQD